MIRRKLLWFIYFIAVFGISCTKDLDRIPKDALTADALYTTEAGYISSLAKIYAGLALTGNAGGAGSGDLGGIDEGFSSYLRNYWNVQELPTDEAVIAWNDATIKDFHNMSWTPADGFLRALYSRIYYQITLANAFIRESSDEKLSGRGFSGAEATKIKGYQAEARFLRALSYWHALDLFGNPTFVTENDPIGAFLPPQITRAELFNYVESELKAVEALLPDAKQNEYARADKAAVWMTLANLYLNAQVYTGTQRFTDAVTYSSKAIAPSYTLEPNYANLFLADNHKSNELIFVVAFDGTRITTYGGTTYLVHAPVGGDMNVNEFGIDYGWGGLRTTKAFVQKFTDPSGATDKRAMFHSAGQSLEINDISDFRSGFSIRKWKNKTSTGANGSNLTFPDTDFPMFRLAEAYLIYAEAVLRGGTGGTAAQALTYINNLRQRAYGNSSGNITSGQLTLDFILDERARELYWEGKRRIDLIRYDRFTTVAYLWPWKGGVRDGRAVESFRNIYPIPAAEINSNPNLVQNPGY
ncbi:MAG: RagB/SusD family nutrient uptake outer membrane protein [Chitinophagaceae bacterium]